METNINLNQGKKMVRIPNDYARFENETSKVAQEGWSYVTVFYVVWGLGDWGLELDDWPSSYIII